jgi:hypothetical protein
MLHIINNKIYKDYYTYLIVQKSYNTAYGYWILLIFRHLVIIISMYIVFL